MQRLLLAVPAYGGTLRHETAAVTFFQPPSGHAVPGRLASKRDPEGIQVDRRVTESSLLARGFNQCWAYALSAEYDYFVMLHSDIVPQAGWLEKLIELIELSPAHQPSQRVYDVVSTVIPIKGPLGITSTAVGETHNIFGLLKRLTMREVYKLPETFTVADIYESGLLPDSPVIGTRGPLLVNTGCFIANLRAKNREGRPAFWERNREGDLAISFQIIDRVGLRTHAEYVAECQAAGIPCSLPPDKQHFFVETCSEDWYFSRCLASQGLRVAATVAVKALHMGWTSFHNFAPWGVETDLLDAPAGLVANGQN